MPKGILGRKLGMTQVYAEDGRAVPVTVIEAGPCPVVQVKRKETDGYEAIQLGFDPVPEARLNKPARGHLSKAKVKPLRVLRELRVEDGQFPEVGAEIKADVFSAGDLVDVIGTSKGRGFLGAVARYHFNRGPMSHGSMYHRRPGTGGATDPQRVFKGRRLPGRVGNARVTVRNLRIERVDPERNLILVRGAVPGVRGAYVLLRAARAAAKKA